jgi:hypothetical protein
MKRKQSIYGDKQKWLLTTSSILSSLAATAQCSLCTKTAQQLGEKPAEGLNSGILYLMLAPFVIVGFIAFQWWKNNKAEKEGTLPLMSNEQVVE